MRITFHGAAGEVTGSCALVEAAGRRILVDCGLFQGGAQEDTRNRAPFPFDPASIDAVVLTHAHLDHCGRLPLLVAAGFRGPIYTQRATRDLVRILLRDAAHLYAHDAETESRKRARRGLPPVVPLFDRAMADRTLARIRAVDYGTWTRVAPGVRMRLHDAGHILGSAWVVLEAAVPGGSRRRVAFSGDLGHAGAPLLRDPEPLAEPVDLLVLESTYGDRDHRPWGETWAELAAILAQAARDGGNVLVPAFAVGRTQRLLYAFARHYREWGLDRWLIFLDSPLAIEATAIYERHRRLYAGEAADPGEPLWPPNLRYARTPLQSMRINRIRAGALVIAGSGMCTGGRIRHHLKHNLWRESCHVIITGYQATGTLGRTLVEGAREVTLWGEPVRVAARIHTVGGLSAHAGRSALLGWATRAPGPPPTVLVHGEPHALEALAAGLEAARLEVRVATPGGTVAP